MTVEINNLNEPNKVNITTTSQKITVVDLVKKETTVVTPPPEETKIITVGIPGPRGHTGLISGSNIHVHHITASGNISASSGGPHYIGNLEVNSDSLGTAKINKFEANQFIGDAAQWVAGGFPGFGHGNAYFRTEKGNTPGFHFIIDGALSAVSAGSQSKAYFRIEKSGNVPDVGTTIFNVDFYGNLTSSGNLSILGGGIHTIDGHLLVNGKIKSIGSDVTLENGHITASGNISASSLILGSETLNSTLLSNLALGLSSTESPETGRKKLNEIEFIISGSNTKKVTLLEGDITASGKIFGQEAQFGDSTIFLDGPNGHITASGEISASGTIYAGDQGFYINNKSGLHESAGVANIFGDNNVTNITLGRAPIQPNISIQGPVTASGNISASGEITSNIANVNTRVKAIGSSLEFSGNSLDFVDGDSLTYLMRASASNAISLYHSGNKKLETTAGGVNITGQITASGDISSSATITTNNLTVHTTMLSNRIDRVDNEKIGVQFGDGINVSGGHITASGNISASDDVYADAYFSENTLIAYNHNNDAYLAYNNSIDSIKIGKLTTQPVIFAGNITASGDISASGELYAGGKLYLNNNEVLSPTGDTLVLNKGGQFTSIGIGRSNQVVPIDLYGNVTASGNISSSAVNAPTGSFDVLEGNATEETGLEVSGYGLFTNITSSNNVSASGILTANTLKIDGSQVDFTGLPTSDPSVAGRLWNSGSYVKVSAG